MKRTALRLILLGLIALAGVSLAGIITTEPSPYSELGLLVAAVASILFVGTAVLAGWRRLRRT